MVGVDIVAEAIRDAHKNAQLNGVGNCKYFTGKAEDILGNILRDIDNKVQSSWYRMMDEMIKLFRTLLQ